MKKQCNLYLILVSSLLLPILLKAGGVKETFTRKITEEFEITPDGKTSITNQYGNVILNHWEKNTVKLVVHIEVKASNKNAADDLFDGIKIDFNHSPSNVSAITLLQFTNQNRYNDLFNSLADLLSSKILKTNNEFKINYEVWLPFENNVDINLKYGNLTAKSIGGHANIDLKYGNFTLNEVKGNTQLKLGYGKGTMVKIKNLNAEIKYSHLYADEVQKADLITKYSTINILHANKLNISSGYDNYKIGGIESIDIETKYSGYNLTLAQQVEKVNLNGSYTGFTLKMPNDNAFEFYTQGKYASFKFPSPVHFNLKIADHSTKEYKGYYKSTRGFFLQAEINYGSLTFESPI
jgi:S-adenosylmethionine hydrolase